VPANRESSKGKRQHSAAGGPLSDDGPRARPAGQPGGRGQARKLEREDDLGIEHRGRQSIDTLRVRCTGHCEHRVAKTASGEGVHRTFKIGEDEPEGEETHEGTRAPARGNTHDGAADPGLEQGLEVDATLSGVVGQPAAGDGANGAKARATDEVVPVRSGEEPPEAGNLDVAAG